MSEFNLNNRELEGKFRGIKNVLECISVLLAFINTYAPLYGDTYHNLNTKLNNITLEFLETLEPKPIYLICIDYIRVKDDKSEIEILDVIKK